MRTGFWRYLVEEVWVTRVMEELVGRKTCWIVVWACYLNSVVIHLDEHGSVCLAIRAMNEHIDNSLRPRKSGVLWLRHEPPVIPNEAELLHLRLDIIRDPLDYPRY